MPSYKEKKQKLRQLVKKEEEQRIRKIQQKGHEFKDTDAFKRSEKHFKYYIHRETDFSKLVDLENLQSFNIEGNLVFKISEPEGAYLVKNFMSTQEQYQIGFEALNRYIYKPYRNNLDGKNGLYKQQQKIEQKLEEQLPINIEQQKDDKGRIQYYFDERIRMSNLGYQYDWAHRSYPSTQVPVPTSINKLTKRAVKLFEKLSQTNLQYNGQAVIVNYYKIRDYMIGHLDDGQIDQKNPIFSFCFGLSCVFLLGFPEKQKQPVAIKLEAGDLMIMSGFSRICYHGVPRIIENSYKIAQENDLAFKLSLPNQDQDFKCPNNKQHIQNYFNTHRLNVNVRQVYPSQKIEKISLTEQIDKINKGEQIDEKWKGQ